MKIDLQNITQTSQWFDTNLFAPYYQRLTAIRNPILLRLSAPLIGIGDGAFSTAQAVSGLIEALVKGSINTALGMVNRDSDQIKKGVLQVRWGGRVIALSLIPVIAFRTLRIIANIAYDPIPAIADLYRKLPISPALQFIET